MDAVILVLKKKAKVLKGDCRCKANEVCWSKKFMLGCTLMSHAFAYKNIYMFIQYEQYSTVAETLIL